VEKMQFLFRSDNEVDLTKDKLIAANGLRRILSIVTGNLFFCQLGLDFEKPRRLVTNGCLNAVADGYQRTFAKSDENAGGRWNDLLRGFACGSHELPLDCNAA
jgi:hypothetical protein